MVATNIVGIPEIITDGFNVLPIPPWAGKYLSEKIITLLSDDGFARRIGQNTRNTVKEKFTLQNSARKTFEVYEKLDQC